MAALAEMYVQGVSTRKVKAITEELIGHSFSASSVSAVVEKLGGELARFAHRPPARSCPPRALPTTTAPEEYDHHDRSEVAAGTGRETRIGKIELRVPQDRQGRFSTELFEGYQRGEKAGGGLMLICGVVALHASPLGLLLSGAGVVTDQPGPESDMDCAAHHQPTVGITGIAQEADAMPRRPR
jgi:hypothetical protein